MNVEQSVNALVEILVTLAGIAVAVAGLALAAWRRKRSLAADRRAA